MKGTKNNIWKVFAINLGKSILGICILIAVGFGSYKNILSLPIEKCD